MSTNLYWDIPKTTQLKSLSTELKWIFIKYYDLGINGMEIHITSPEYYFIRGLAAADIKGAQELFDLITEHDKIKLWIAE